MLNLAMLLTVLGAVCNLKLSYADALVFGCFDRTEVVKYSHSFFLGSKRKKIKKKSNIRLLKGNGVLISLGAFLSIAALVSFMGCLVS